MLSTYEGGVPPDGALWFHKWLDETRKYPPPPPPPPLACSPATRRPCGAWRGFRNGCGISGWVPHSLVVSPSSFLPSPPCNRATPSPLPCSPLPMHRLAWRCPLTSCRSPSGQPTHRQGLNVFDVMPILIRPSRVPFGGSFLFPFRPAATSASRRSCSGGSGSRSSGWGTRCTPTPATSTRPPSRSRAGCSNSVPRG